MSTKQALLAMLEENRGDTISGEAAAANSLFWTRKS